MVANDLSNEWLAIIFNGGFVLLNVEKSVHFYETIASEMVASQPSRWSNVRGLVFGNDPN